MIALSMRAGVRELWLRNGGTTLVDESLADTELAYNFRNDEAIQFWAARSQLIVVAWGTHCERERASTVVENIRRVGAEPMCLRFNRDRSPRHPLYVRADTSLVVYRAEVGQ